MTLMSMFPLRLGGRGPLGVADSIRRQCPNLNSIARVCPLLFLSLSTASGLLDVVCSSPLLAHVRLKT
jgi:hypothetical protein